MAHIKIKITNPLPPNFTTTGKDLCLGFCSYFHSEDALPSVTVSGSSIIAYWAVTFGQLFLCSPQLFFKVLIWFFPLYSIHSLALDSSHLISQLQSKDSNLITLGASKSKYNILSGKRK